MKQLCQESEQCEISKFLNQDDEKLWPESRQNKKEAKVLCSGLSTVQRKVLLGILYGKNYSKNNNRLK